MAQTRLICRPWAGVGDLPAARPDLPETTWEGLLWQASELLYALSGRQYSGGCESAVTLYADEGRWGWAPWPYSAGTGLPYPAQVVGRYGWTGGTGEPRVVVLPDPPVTTIHDVSIGGQPAPYRADLPVGHLTRPGGRPWPVDGSLVVTYEHGIPPPIGGSQSAVLLATELGKAFTGDDKCRLPRRLQTITREGVTVGFQDSFESLDKGRTGVWEIDVWLRAENPQQLARRAAVWSPDLARAKRRTL